MVCAIHFTRTLSLCNCALVFELIHLIDTLSFHTPQIIAIVNVYAWLSSIVWIFIRFSHTRYDRQTFAQTIVRTFIFFCSSFMSLFSFIYLSILKCTFLMVWYYFKRLNCYWRRSSNACFNCCHIIFCFLQKFAVNASLRHRLRSLPFSLNITVMWLPFIHETHI